MVGGEEEVRRKERRGERERWPEAEGWGAGGKDKMACIKMSAQELKTSELTIIVGDWDSERF